MPTKRQQTAAVKLVENGGNVSKAMIDAGYSPATAKTPQKLTQSEGFQMLMQQMGITDELLVETIKGVLSANKMVVMGKESTDSFVDIQPDHPTRHKFLETTLKLKGLSKGEGSTSITFIAHAREQQGIYDL